MEDGKAVGVKAESKEHNYTIKAKAVVIATGVMNAGGAETLIMEILRNRSGGIQYVMLIHHSGERTPGMFDEEIRQMGIPMLFLPSVGSVGQKRYTEIFLERIRQIGHAAFWRCKKPERIMIPQTVENIGDYAFFKCTSLRNMLIPGSVDSIGNSAFAECSGLTAVKILDGVKSIDNCAFQNCTHLTNVLVPDSVTEVGFKVFDGCEMLKSVRIKNYKGKEGFLPDYSMLERLDNGNDSDYVNVDGVVFNRNMTELIRYPVFKDNAKYTVPAGVKKIKESAFYRNEHLTEVIIPDGVTHIEHRAFESCRNLRRITIPPSVTYMGNFVFLGIHTSPNSKQQKLSSDIMRASVKSIIGAIESYSTSEGILIRGKKGSEAERYARENGCAFEDAKEM